MLFLALIAPKHQAVFWILLSIILWLIMFKLYGKKGVNSALLFTGMLLLNDAVAYFLGKTAEWLLVSVYVLVAILIYISKRNKTS